MNKIEIKDLYLVFGPEKQKAFRMLKERKSKNEILNFVSERDELTQIKNRRGFMEQAMNMNRIYKNRKAVLRNHGTVGQWQINFIALHKPVNQTHKRTSTD